MRLPEAHSIRTARHYGEKASFTNPAMSSFGEGTYIKFSDVALIGESFLNVNRGLERTDVSKLRVKSLQDQEKRDSTHRLGEISTNMVEMTDCKTQTAYDALSAQTMRFMGSILASDPLNPDLHLKAGDFFLDYSQTDSSQAHNLPAYRNIISLIAYANASRLQPDSMHARTGMEEALQLTVRSVNSFSELERLRNKGLERLIKGSILIEDGEYEKGIRLLKKVPQNSSYAWLANKKVFEVTGVLPIQTKTTKNSFLTTVYNRIPSAIH